MPDSQQLLDRLRNDITGGHFRPGEWLRQVDLEKRYGANRSTVRRALETLASRGGLVEHVLNRGFRVRETDLHDRHELTDVRLMIEQPVALAMMDTVTPSQVEKMRLAAEAFSRATEAGSLADIRQLNHRFHTAFWDASPNRTAVRLINELRERDLPGSGTSWTNARAIALSNNDHFDLITALTARDGDVLRGVIARHLNRWRSSD